MATIGTLNIILAASTAKFTGGIGAAEAKLRGFTRSLGSLKPLLAGLGFTAGVAGAAVAVKKMISAGAEFENQMQAVKAVSGASGAEFDRLSDKARELGTGFFSAKEAAEGMEILAQAGFDTETILKTIEPTLNLAAAGSVELSVAADVASSTMRGMGIEADKLQNVVDVLAKASSASNADIAGLGEALKSAGPIAHAAGVGIEQTVASIEALSNAGIKGEEAGVAMRQIFTRMASQTPEAAKTLKQLGISMTDVAGNLRPVADVVDDVNAKLASMGSGKKLDVLSTVFDARGAGHFAALLGQGGDALRKFESELSAASAAGKGDLLTRSLDKIKPPATIKGAPKQANDSQRTLASLGVSATDAAGQAKPLADVLDELSKKMAGMDAAAKLQNLSKIFDPTAAATFAGVLDTGIDKLRAFEADLGSGVGEAAKQAETRMDSLSGSGKKFAHALGGLSITLMQSLGPGLRTIVDFGTRVVASLSAMAGRVQQITGGAMGLVNSEIGDKLARAGQIVAAGWQAVSDVFARLTPGFVGGTVRQFGILLETIGAVLAPIVSIVSDNWQAVADVFVAIYPQIVETSLALFSAVGEIVVMGWQAIVDVFSAAGRLVGSVSQAIFGGLFGTAATSMDGFVDVIQAGLVTIEFGFAHWKDLVILSGLAVIASLVTFGNQIAYVFTEVIPKTLSWFAENWRDILFTMFDWTTTVFINLGQNIRNAMGAIWDYIASGGKAKLELTWTPLTTGFAHAIRKLPEIADREIGLLEQALYDDIAKRERDLGRDFDAFAAKRGKEFSDRKKTAGLGTELKVPPTPELPPAPDTKLAPAAIAAPAGVGESKGTKALELGSAEAFHSSFGKSGGDGRTLKDILGATRKQQRDTERMKQIQEQNRTATASF